MPYLFQVEVVTQLIILLDMSLWFFPILDRDGHVLALVEFNTV